MMKLAHVVNGAIAGFPAVDPVLAKNGFTLSDCFEANFLATCVQVPDAAQVGWSWDGNTATAPAVAVIAPAVRSVQGAILVHNLDKATKICPRDLAYVAGLTMAREDMSSLARMAVLDGLTVKSWFDAALGVSA